MSRFAAIVENSAQYFGEFGVWGLITMSFIEASFFPIPPDLVLIPLSLLNPGMALWYSLIATVASVTGGVLGYFIGSTAGRPILSKFVCDEKIRKIDRMLTRYGGWAVAIAGFTPIPYKFFTIAAGVSRINMATFLIASLLGRGGRFFLEGLVIMSLGASAGRFLDKYLELGTLAITLALALGYLAFRYRDRLKMNRSKGVCYEKED